MRPYFRAGNSSLNPGAHLRARILSLAVAVIATPLPVSAPFAATWDVDTTTDSAAATYQVCSAEPDDCSLRGAILKSNATPGPNTINVPSGTYTLTVPGSGDAAGDLDIRNNALSIVGAGATTTIVRGGWTGFNANRIFDINDGGASVLVVAISGLTITNGSLYDGDGGGVRANRTTLNLTDDIITDNLG
jgi:hypothetical protein